MIVHLVASAVYWFNTFPPSTPGSVLLDKKIARQLVIGTVVDYNNFPCLQPGEYVQVNQEDKPLNMNDSNRTVGVIFIGTQYNLQGGYFFEILLT